MAHFPFLRLTAELRNQVYEFLFPPGLVYRICYKGSYQGCYSLESNSESSRFVHSDDVHRDNGRKLGGNGMGLLRTCRQLYNECVQIAYQNPIFGVLDTFEPLSNCAMPFFTSIGNQALLNLRHLSLRIEPLSPPTDHYYDMIAVTRARDLTEGGRAVLDKWLSHTTLKSLYVAYDFTGYRLEYYGSLLGFCCWKWLFSTIERNQIKKIIDNIFVELRVSELPPQRFIDSLISRVKAWHDSTPVSQYKNWRLEDVKKLECSDTRVVTDYSGYELLYTDVREASNGAQTHLSIRMKEEDDESVSKMGVLSGRD
ncbi:hypothetical protein MMC18_000078 [Xylographa bjoerkii]|nr:hypothetical protein [Xylographa bjoerkii]